MWGISRIFLSVTLASDLKERFRLYRSTRGVHSLRGICTDHSQRRLHSRVAHASTSPNTFLASRDPSSRDDLYGGGPLCAFRGGGERTPEVEHESIVASAGKNDLSQYNLLWSPKAFMNIGRSFIMIFAIDSALRSLFPCMQVLSSFLFQWGLHSTQSCHQAQRMTQKLATTKLGVDHGALGTQLFHLVVVPLMASACCSLQLIINLFAGGCAGFNTYLGPLRPHFLAYLLYSAFVSFPWHHQALFRNWFGAFVVSLTCSLLPEIIHTLNIARERSKITPKTRPQEPSRDNAVDAVVEIDIPTMGCVACIKKIDDKIFNSFPDTVRQTSTLLNGEGQKGGKCRISFTADSAEQAKITAALMVESIKEAGFGSATLEHLNA